MEMADLYKYSVSLYLRNEFVFWKDHGIMNTWGHLQRASL